jgi:hypothetical protein
MGRIRNVSLHFMKKNLFAAILLCLFSTGLGAETIDLREYGRLNFTLDPVWKVAKANAQDGTVEVMISPPAGVNAYAGFTITVRPGLATTSRERMQAALIEDSREEAAGSVERRTVPKEFPVKDGFGFSADFTDRALVGKPEKKGDFKVQTKVVMVFGDTVGVSGALASNGPGDRAHAQLLAVFQSMQLQPPAPVKD